MRIAVVVVTYNSAEDLLGLLPTLELAPGSELESTVVVVDNGSSDETVAVAEASPWVDSVVRSENRGYAAGINVGAEAVGEFDALLVLNPDVRLDRSALDQLAQALSDEDVGIVAPRLVGADGTLLWSIRREPTVIRAWATAVLGGRRAGRLGELGEMDCRAEHYAQARDVDWATGAALLLSRRCWDRVGPWDESFFLYSEETDFCLRARDAGLRTLFVPTAVVAHLEGDMTAPRLAAFRSVSAVRLFRKRHATLPTIMFAGGVLVHSLLRIGRASERAAAAAILRPASRPEPVRRLPLLRRLPPGAGTAGAGSVPVP